MKISKGEIFIEKTLEDNVYKDIFSIKTILSKTYSILLSSVSFDYNILKIVEKIETNDEDIKILQIRLSNFYKCYRTRIKDFEIVFEKLIEFGVDILKEISEMEILRSYSKQNIIKAIEGKYDNYIYIDCYVHPDFIKEELLNLKKETIRFIIIKVCYGYSIIINKEMYEIIEIDSKVSIQSRIPIEKKFEYKVTNNNTLVTYTLENAIEIVESFEKEKDIYNIL